MTSPSQSAIFIIRKKKRTICVHGKEGIQMRTTMIFDYLAYDCLEKALDEKQSFVFAYTFLREQNQVEHKEI